MDTLGRLTAIVGLFFSLANLSAKGAPIEEEASFNNVGAFLSGTLVIPDDRPLAAVVLIHGAGPEQRMLPLARLFASDGIAVLTYDKRGVGQSNGHYEGPNNISAADLELLAGDAATALQLLLRHPKLKGVPAGY